MVMVGGSVEYGVVWCGVMWCGAVWWVEWCLWFVLGFASDLSNRYPGQIN